MVMARCHQAASHYQNQCWQTPWYHIVSQCHNEQTISRRLNFVIQCLSLALLIKLFMLQGVVLFPFELNQNKKVQYTLSTNQYTLSTNQYTLSMNQSQPWQLTIYSRIVWQSCIFQTHTREIAQIGSDQICKMKIKRNWQLSTSKRCMTLIQRTEFETRNLNLNQCRTKQYWTGYFWYLGLTYIRWISKSIDLGPFVTYTVYWYQHSKVQIDFKFILSTVNYRFPWKYLNNSKPQKNPASPKIPHFPLCIPLQSLPILSETSWILLDS